MELAEQKKRQEIERLSGVEIPLEGDLILIPLKELSERYGVGVEALKGVIAQRLDESYHLLGDKVISSRLLAELLSKIEALPDEGEGKSYSQVLEVLEEYGLGLSVLRAIGYKVEYRSLLEGRVVKVRE